MPNALTDLHRSRQLLENAERLLEHAATSLTQSRALIRRGKARAVLHNGGRRSPSVRRRYVAGVARHSNGMVI
jgi:hypothetical protein